MKSLNDLKVQIYADGADKAGILELYAKPYIKGLTTNPSLMKKAGIKDYEAFAEGHPPERHREADFPRGFHRRSR
jgi:transaldolase